MADHFRRLDELAVEVAALRLIVRSVVAQMLMLSPARMTDTLKSRLSGASVVLFDGTLWRDDEMVRAGLGPKTGQRMGHMSVSGPDGTLAAFRDIPVGRKILVHINNSNPILLDDSSERHELGKEGWEVAHDGMEVSP